MMFRVSYFFGIVLVGLMLPWWVVVIVALPYLYIYTAYELCFAAILIDGYYGVLGDRPVLSMILIGLCIVIEYVKPYIAFGPESL